MLDECRVVLKNPADCRGQLPQHLLELISDRFGWDRALIIRNVGRPGRLILLILQRLPETRLAKRGRYFLLAARSSRQAADQQNRQHGGHNRNVSHASLLRTESRMVNRAFLS
jgi:hypothetical protein